MLRAWVASCTPLLQLAPARLPYVAVQDSQRRPGASRDLTKLRQKLSEDLGALQELLLDT